MLPPDSLPANILSNDPDDEFTYTGGCYPADLPEAAPSMDPIHEPEMDAVRHTDLPRSHDVMTGELLSGSDLPESDQWTQSAGRTVMSVITYTELDTDRWRSTFLTNGH